MAGFLKGFRHPGGQPMVDVEFAAPGQENFIRVRALIDTGADCSHLNVELLERLGAPKIRGTLHYGHGPEMFHGDIFDVRVRLTGQLENNTVSHKLFRTDALGHTARPDAGYQALLGWSLLKALDLHFLRDGSFELRWFDDRNGMS